MTLTREEIKKLFPNASEDCLQENEAENRSQVSDAKPKRNKKAALGQAATGETSGLVCPLVRFIGYRVRPLDPDNFAGSVKDLLDGLRHSGLIPGDESWRIRLTTGQVKVSKKDHEKTVIEIES